jgi:hypothetical protein
MPCKFGGYLDYAGDAQLGIPPAKIPWSYPEDWGTSQVPVEYKIKREPTPAEEIFELVREYYKEQGKGIPPAEAKQLIDAIKEEKHPKEPAEPEPERPKTAEEILGPRPAWGDPMYWPWWNKAKALGLVKPKEKKVKSPKVPKVPKVPKSS